MTIDEIIKRDDLKKDQLEARFDRELKSLFAQINRANSQSILITGLALDAFEFETNFENLLYNHYERVQNAFNGSVESTLPESDRGLTESEQLAMLSAMLGWRKQRSKEIAKIISATNREQLVGAVNKATELTRATGSTRRDVARDSAAIFKRSYKQRVGTIKTTETQSTAEVTKLMEAATLSGADPNNALSVIHPITQSTKTWRTVGDKLVRDIHRSVNGVSKPLNGIFTVGGEPMMHPGDSSLGASAKNYAHCRCSMTYNIVRQR